MMSNNTSAQKHVAVLTFPFSSHAGVLFALLGRLAGAAPGVQFSFFSTAKENSSLFSAPTPRNINAFDVSEGIPEGYVFEGRHAEDIELFLKAAPENFRLRVRAAEDEMGMKVSCVVTDAFLWFSAEMAEEMRVPWLPLWTSGAAPLAVHVYTDFIRQTVGVGTTNANIAGRNDEIVKFIPGFSEVSLADLPTGVIFGNFDSPFSIMLHKMGQNLPRATAVSINSFQELDLSITQDLRVNKFQKFLHIGPLNLTSAPLLSNSDEHGCIRWLANQRPASVVYIGFGTVATPPPVELKELAEAVEESGSPFLWSLKDNLKCHLPEGFLERTSNYGKVEPWVPQVMALSHSSVGVFISHCGWSSVMESIAAGVPMIGRPFFGDQQLNTWMIENVWKIGVRVKDGVFTKSGVTSAIGLVLSHEKGKIMKERVKMYKGLAFKAVGPNGNSTENFKALLGIITL